MAYQIVFSNSYCGKSEERRKIMDTESQEGAAIFYTKDNDSLM